MTRRIGFAFPGDLATPTGGYGYDRRVIAEIESLGVAVTPLSLAASFPDPAPDDLAQAERMLREARWDGLVIDGLAFGALPVGLVTRLDPAPVALVHHPLCLETGLTAARAMQLKASERQALACAGAIVTTSETTAGIVVRDFGISRSKVFVAPPGVDPAERAEGSSDGNIHLVSVGSLLPRKGYGDLMRALAGVEGRWRLSVVGSTELDSDHARSIRGLVAALGLSARVEIEGALPAEEVGRRYAGADAFVTASYFEGYGMAIAEAIARGLPVVATAEAAAAGAAPGPATLTYPAGDIVALRKALVTVVDDAALRDRLGEAAWAAAHAQPRWPDAARIVLDAIEFATRRGR